MISGIDLVIGINQDTISGPIHIFRGIRKHDIPSAKTRALIAYSQCPRNIPQEFASQMNAIITFGMNLTIANNRNSPVHKIFFCNPEPLEVKNLMRQETPITFLVPYPILNSSHSFTSFSSASSALISARMSSTESSFSGT